jgi:hypothetical protein
VKRVWPSVLSEVWPLFFSQVKMRPVAGKRGPAATRGDVMFARSKQLLNHLFLGKKIAFEATFPACHLSWAEDRKMGDIK